MKRTIWTIVGVAAVASFAACRPSSPDELSSTGKAAGAVEQIALPEAKVHGEEASEPVPSEVAVADVEVSEVAQAGLPDPQPNAKPEETVTGTSRGIHWRVPARWPETGEVSEFRVRTWRLPAMSMDGAGECGLFRFPGGGDVQDNLHRWMGQFRGPDGTVESVQAEQAMRTINGLPGRLARAQGTYLLTDLEGNGTPEERFDNYGLFGAVIEAPGDPVFVKCVGPLALISSEANAILGFMDSLLIQEN